MHNPMRAWPAAKWWVLSVSLSVGGAWAEPLTPPPAPPPSAPVFTPTPTDSNRPLASDIPYDGGPLPPGARIVTRPRQLGIGLGLATFALGYAPSLIYGGTLVLSGAVFGLLGLSRAAETALMGLLLLLPVGGAGYLFALTWDPAPHPDPFQSNARLVWGASTALQAVGLAVAGIAFLNPERFVRQDGPVTITLLPGAGTSPQGLTLAGAF